MTGAALPVMTGRRVLRGVAHLLRDLVLACAGPLQVCTELMASGVEGIVPARLIRPCLSNGKAQRLTGGLVVRLIGIPGVDPRCETAKMRSGVVGHPARWNDDFPEFGTSSSIRVFGVLYLEDQSAVVCLSDDLRVPPFSRAQSRRYSRCEPHVGSDGPSRSDRQHGLSQRHEVIQVDILDLPGTGSIGQGFSGCGQTAADGVYRRSAGRVLRGRRCVGALVGHVVQIADQGCLVLPESTLAQARRALFQPFRNIGWRQSDLRVGHEFVRYFQQKLPGSIQVASGGFCSA